MLYPPMPDFEEKQTLDKAIFFFEVKHQQQMQSTSLICVTTTYILDVNCKTKQCTSKAK